MKWILIVLIVIWPVVGFPATETADKNDSTPTSASDASALTSPVENGYPYFLTTSVFPVDQGMLSVTIAPWYIENSDRRDLLLFPQFSYGITDDLQVFLGFIPYQITWQDDGEHTQGQGDTTLGFQYSWMYIKKSNCSAAVGLSIIVPTGDINKNLTDGLIHCTPYFILTKDFIHGRWRTQLFSQVAVSIVDRVKSHSDASLNNPSAHAFVYSGGISERTEKINLSLEYSWLNDTWNNHGVNNQQYVTPGIYVQVRKDVALGLGVPIGLTKSSANYQIIANLYVDIDTIFKKKKDDDGDDKKNGNDKKTEDRFSEKFLNSRAGSNGKALRAEARRHKTTAFHRKHHSRLHTN